MCAFNSRSTVVACGTRWGLAALLTIGLATQVRAQETLTLTGSQPRIFFVDDIGMNDQQWRILADEIQFRIGDDTANTTPFRILPGTPDDTLSLKLDIEGNGNVGINGEPADDVNLHIRSFATPKIRLEQTWPTHEKVWDIRASETEWRVVDVGVFGHKIPFAIETDTPTNTLCLSSQGNGHVGIGTLQPHLIAGVATGGNARMLNLNAGGGLARAVIQGGLGSEMYFVHLGGAVNRKITRFGVDGGKFRIGSVLDNLAGNVEPYGFCLDLTTTNVGIKTGNPAFPLQVGDAGANDGNGAHVTAGGVWTNASSRAVKQDIEPISSEQARAAVCALQPVGYRYKNELDEKYVGFIAEDVPELVATKDRKSLAPMDVVAVLTKVVQDQDRIITEELARNDRLEATVLQQRDLLEVVSKRLAQLEAKSR